jgi:dihydrofolate reductase
MFKLIMAISKNGVIGDKGKLAWKCPEDMAHFKETTAGGICVMGRKTYQGLPKPTLDGRVIIVISRTMRPIPVEETKGGEGPAGVQVVRDISACLKAVKKIRKTHPGASPFVCGGNEVGYLFMKAHLVHKVIFTNIPVDVQGDTK